jgi:hypothetical protein
VFKLKVLFLNNNFYGSYESNQVFLSEAVQAFKLLGVKVRIVASVPDAIRAYGDFKPDFTLCFSKYFYFLNDKPLYDIYSVPHYQWVSDNPLKIGIDLSSHFIHYIFIDKEFSLMADTVNKPLYLPLGYLEGGELIPVSEPIDAVLIPCKIRNLEDIAAKIRQTPHNKEIVEFLGQYNYGSSFIKAFKSYCLNHKVVDMEKFFRITNEYVRVKKRLAVVNNINSYKVYIVGEDFGNKLKCRKGVNFIHTRPYQEIGKLMNKFRFVINVDPNYHVCIHDRFIRTVSSGSCCITNYNDVMDNWNSNTYQFGKEDHLDSLLESCKMNWCDIAAEQRLKIKRLSWQQSAKAIIQHFYTSDEVDAYAV